MQSPLNIKQTVENYSLGDSVDKLIEFDSFIWQDIEIVSVVQLLEFEKQYQEYASIFNHCFDSEVGEFGCVDMKDGSMHCLEKGRFQLFAKEFEQNPVAQAYLEVGLTDLEALVIMTFLADLSVLYRLDSYPYGVPPFVSSIISILDRALRKLPVYNDTVVRACKEHDRCMFKMDEVFSPNFFITTSADLGWADETRNRYRITPLRSDDTKARALFKISDNTEKQVTFLQGTRFRINSIQDWGDGKKEIIMSEI